MFGLGGENMYKGSVAVGIRCLVAAIVAAGGASLFSAEGTVSARVTAAHSAPVAGSKDESSIALAAELGVEFVKGSSSSVVLERGGKKYLVDLASQRITLADPPPPLHAPVEQKMTARAAPTPNQGEGSTIFAQKCSQCHGSDGKGIPSIKTPNWTDPRVQASITDEQMIATIKNGKSGTLMPAWSGKLSEEQIQAVAAHLRSLGQAGGAKQQAAAPKPKIYEPGDDVVFTLPTGRRLERHGLYLNFAHRFVYDTAFTGTARGGALLGLDGFAIPSFGFRYAFTSKLSGGIFRAPSIIGRPIQLMLGYNVIDEHDGYPLNMAVRFSVEGKNSFLKQYTENIEGIFSRSLGSRAQIYFVPTVSFNDRRLESVNIVNYYGSEIPDVPGHNTLSLGVGGALDIRPTVALVAEVVPTVVNGRPLDIHRPAYSFGIQKKIWRHAFTLGFSNSPGTTVAERAGTRATLLNDPTADKPSGLFIGFDLTRQLF
jgi:mono/diheme cytochrome c family protein